MVSQVMKAFLFLTRLARVQISHQFKMIIKSLVATNYIAFIIDILVKCINYVIIIVLFVCLFITNVNFIIREILEILR